MEASERHVTVKGQGLDFYIRKSSIEGKLPSPTDCIESKPSLAGYDRLELPSGLEVREMNCSEQASQDQPEAFQGRHVTRRKHEV